MPRARTGSSSSRAARAVGERRRLDHQGRRPQDQRHHGDDRRPAASCGPTPWPSTRTADGHRRQFQRRAAVPQPDLDRARPQDLAKLPVPQSAENLERSAWHAPSGTFYTAIPVLSADKSKGLLAQTDPNSGTIIKLHELERCHPHSLSIVSDTTIFLGCSSAHGPNRKPGGDMAVFDIATGRIEAMAKAGRQWRLDRRSASAATIITPPPMARWSWSTPRPGSSCKGADLERRALARRQSRPARSMSRPPPRAARAAAASWRSRRSEA